MSAKERRALREGEWACTDPKCTEVNAERTLFCQSCGRAKPKPKAKVGREIGKDAAEKSKGLFAAEDWICTKCGNVNWARRNTCNICNAKKLGDTERRTGYGGGYMDRQDVEYIQREDDAEFDEFGRKKKRKQSADGAKAGETQDDEIEEVNDFNQPEEESEKSSGSETSASDEGSGHEDEDEDEDLDKYDLTADDTELKDKAKSKENDEDDENEEEDDDLDKYDLTAGIEITPLQLAVANKANEDYDSDCTCSCSGGECSCSESESEIERRREEEKKKERELQKENEKQKDQDREKDREKDRKRKRSRSREKDRKRSRSRERDRERKRSRSRSKDKKRSRSRDKTRRSRDRSRSRDRRRDRLCFPKQSTRASEMSGLQFQSFTSADFSTSASNEQGFNGKIGDKNQDDGSAATTGTKRNFFSFSFYQQFFDVDTEQVTKRLMNSVIPTHNSFIADFIQPMPDLYGPFWVAVTLVFSIGIFSNIAQYIENEGGTGEYGSDFRMVTGASTLITSYLVFIPLILYALIWYRKSEVQFSYFEILCAYGYSLTIFIPVSLLWVIDVGALRWALIGISVALSGTVLVKALWPAFKNDANKLISFGVVFGIIFFHFLLALCFKEYFFDAVHGRSPAPLGKNEVDVSKPPIGAQGVPDHSNSSIVPPPVLPKLPAKAESQKVPIDNSTVVAPNPDRKNDVVNAVSPPVSGTNTNANDTKPADSQPNNAVEQKDKKESKNETAAIQ
ncbi:unnamed protein product, partial [Mesorhabditis belari]|uniref:RanBP2-type domain-containing protein n=1 Tax=Mesorhabditis belari TaxID=2138241 RepID=A0AAF3F5A6_9BILA